MSVQPPAFPVSLSGETKEISRAREDRQAFLLHLSDALRPLDEPAQIQETACRLLGEHLEAGRVVYAETDGEGFAWPDAQHTRGLPRIEGPLRLEHFDAALFEKSRQGQAVIRADLASDARLSAAQKAMYVRHQIGASVAVPLAESGEIVALLGVHHQAPHAWAHEEVMLVQETAERVCAAMERARTKAAMAADLRDTQMLRELGARFVGDTDIESFGSQVVEVARKLTSADAGTVQIFDAEAQQLLLLATQGFPPDAPDRFGQVEAASATSCGMALQSGERTFVAFDDPALEDPKGDLRWHVEAGYLSAQSTPLIARSGKPIGMVSTHWRTHRQPGERELRFLDLLARQAADMIDQWQAKAALRESEEKKAFLLALSDAIRTLVDPEEIMRVAAEMLGTRLQVTQVGYAETDNGETYLDVRVDWTAAGRSSGVGHHAMPAQHGEDIRCYQAGLPWVVADAETDPRQVVRDAAATYVEAGARATVNVPLVKEGRWVAMLYATSSEARRWTADEIQLVREVAERTWPALELARAQEALHASEEQLRFIVNQTTAGIVQCDASGTITFANHKFGAITGYSAQELLGRPMQSITHPDDVSRNLELFSRLLQTGEPFDIETRDVRKDGSTVWIHNSVSSLHDAEGQVKSVLAVCVDITERKQAEEALREAKEAAELANQSKDHFLAVLSHELRTPLTPVLMTVDALEHDPALSPAVREDLAMMRRNIQLETKLIDDLLDISRITSGKLALHLGAVDLNELVRNVGRICGPLAHERGIDLQIVLDRNAGVISADSARLQQVLWNVLMNAIKFTATGGTIHVSTAWLPSGRCEVRVRDNGAGIAPEVVPHIFNAFEQGGAGVTRQFGGLGLGLAISKALMELHHGSIRAESAGAGQGATFIMDLPGMPMTATAKIRLATPPAKDKPLNLRLLVVEDHADTARTLAILLRRAGFTVQTAPSVEEAIAAASSGSFDLLVSDLGLPDGTGYDVMRSVRSTLGIPGVAMSGFGMEEDVRRSREAGFSEHLVKPIDVTELIAAIRRVAARKIKIS